MDDLLELEATATGLGPAPFRPATPLKVAAYLQSHPDHRFTNYILNGFTHGFHIGANRKAGLRSAPKIFSAVADALAWSLHCKGV